MSPQITSTIKELLWRLALADWVGGAAADQEATGAHKQKSPPRPEPGGRKAGGAGPNP
jgi:hypothetical protein